MGQLQGVMTAIVTPFDETGAQNLDALPDFLAYQRAAGIDGVVVAGTNGEGVSQSVEERKRLLEAVMRLKGDFTVVAGTGAASVVDAVELTRHAGEVGADAALALPPFFFKHPSAQGLADYFRHVLDAASIPVLLYSIPQFSAVPITDDVLLLLRDHPRLAGLKDSAGQWERTHQLLTEWPQLKIFPGADELLGQSLQAGAVGAISGTANAFPELVAGVKRAHESGGDVAVAQTRVNQAKDILIRFPLIAVSKSVLAHRGVPRMDVRPPLISLTDAQEKEVLARLREAGLI
jgi:4-hydroxy-tetrahydrodipicolinate synthase